jgi:hypothetical protein
MFEERAIEHQGNCHQNTRIYVEAGNAEEAEICILLRHFAGPNGGQDRENADRGQREPPNC